MGTNTPLHLARLELRHRALAFQRRRFWREVSYGGVMLLADVITLSAVFVFLAMLPLESILPGSGVRDAESFVRGLLPQTPVALIRRVTSLLFCLMVTRSYDYMQRPQLPARIAAALLLGLVLPRWQEVWTAQTTGRWLLIGGVLAVTWGVMSLQRRGMSEVLRPIDPRRLDPARTLIVGPADDVQRLAVERKESGGVTPPMFPLSDSWPTGTQESMRGLYDAMAESATDTIVLVGSLTDSALQAVMIASSSAGASVYATRREAFRELDEPSFVLRRAEPLALLSRPALVGSQLVIKRAMDMVGSLLGLIVLSPVMLFVALSVRLTSKGPVFFRQTRVGLGGDPFMMLKFRTMVHDAERQQEALEQANVYSGTPLFKLAHDPRLTSIGMFMRRSSLDELPQLFNVLNGEMSLVGPRPAVPAEVLKYKQHHFVRFEVLPGMTGPWQVSGRNAIRDFEDVVRLDAAYIRGWTVWKDLAILLRTIPAVLSMKGAY